MKTYTAIKRRSNHVVTSYTEWRDTRGSNVWSRIESDWPEHVGHSVRDVGIHEDVEVREPVATKVKWRYKTPTSSHLITPRTEWKDMSDPNDTWTLVGCHFGQSIGNFMCRPGNTSIAPWFEIFKFREPV